MADWIDEAARNAADKITAHGTPANMQPAVSGMIADEIAITFRDAHSRHLAEAPGECDCRIELPNMDALLTYAWTPAHLWESAKESVRSVLTRQPVKHCPACTARMAARAEAERLREQHPVACTDCSAPYGLDGWCDVVVPDEIWNRLAPEGGLLCFRCMTKRIEALSLDKVPVIVASGPYRDANEEWRQIGWDHGHKVARTEMMTPLPNCPHPRACWVERRKGERRQHEEVVSAISNVWQLGSVLMETKPFECGHNHRKADRRVTDLGGACTACAAEKARVSAALEIAVAEADKAIDNMSAEYEERIKALTEKAGRKEKALEDRLIFEETEHNREYKELTDRLAVAEAMVDTLGHPVKSPCGCSSQYAYSEDGGKNIRCLICGEKALREAANLRRNTRWEKGKELIGEWTCVPTEDFDALRAALAGKPEGKP